MRKFSFHKLSDKSFHGKVFMKINFAYLCRVIGKFAEGMTTLIVFTVSSPRNLATAIEVFFFIAPHTLQQLSDNTVPFLEWSSVRPQST